MEWVYYLRHLLAVSSTVATQRLCWIVKSCAIVIFPSRNRNINIYLALFPHAFKPDLDVGENLNVGWVQVLP